MAVVVHEPLLYWPAAQVLVQLRHAVWYGLGWYVPVAQAKHCVWLPEDGEYVPALHVVHVGVAVVVHDPDIYCPAAQLVVQVVQCVWLPADG